VTTAYCTTADVAMAAGKYQTLSAAETTAASASIIQAQAIIEKATGTFFYQAHLQVTTEPVNRVQTRLFLPAPCLSIDNNTITENGSVLTLGTDFLLYQPSPGGIPTGPGYLEKMANSVADWVGPAAIAPWAKLQQSVVVSGVFGYASVPADINKLCAWKAAELLGWLTIDYSDGGGISHQVGKNGMPDWALRILRGRTLNFLDEQYFGIKVLS